MKQRNYIKRFIASNKKWVRTIAQYGFISQRKSLLSERATLSWRKHRGSRFVIYYSIIIMVIITLGTLILYSVFSNALIKTNQNYMQKRIDDVIAKTNALQNSIRSMAVQIYLDEDVATVLRGIDVTDEDRSVMAKRMSYYKNTNPYIDSIAVYTSSNRLIYLDGEALRLEDYSDDLDLMRILESSETEDVMFQISRQESTLKYICVIFPYSNSKDALIFQFYPNVISDFEDDTAVFVITNQVGQVLFSNNEFAKGQDINAESFVTETNDIQSGSYTININGGKRLVVFSHENQLNYYYLINYHNTLQGVEQIILQQLLIVIVIIFITGIIIFVGSRNTRLQFAHIFQQMHDLQDSLGNIKRRSHSGMLKELIKRSDRFSEAQLEEMLDIVNLAIPEYERLRMVLIKLDHFERFSLTYSTEEQSALKFGVVNVSKEIMQTIDSIEVCDMEPDEIVILCDEKSFPSETLVICLDKIQMLIEKHLALSLSFYISEPIVEIYTLEDTYQKLVELAKYRFYEGNGCILNAENYHPSNSNLEFNLEKFALAIVEKLRCSDMVKCEQLLEEVKNACSDFTPEYCRLVLMNLVFEVGKLLQKGQTTDTMEAVMLFTKDVDTIDEALRIILERFREMSENYLKNSVEKHKELVRQINEFVKEKYGEPTLSLEMISEHFSLSPRYMTQIYKQITGQTIVQYISEYRMEIARYLLKQNFRIAEIAKQVGYTSASYFIRNFKKRFGVTPTSYIEIERAGQEHELNKM